MVSITANIVKFNTMGKENMTPRYQPFVTVAIVVESQGKFLIVEEIPRGSAKVTFNQPAGHLEADETLIAAAQRELLEETGLTLELDQLIGVYQYFTPGKQFIRFTFQASIATPVPITPIDPQIIAGHWLTLEQIRKCPNLRSPLVTKCIEDYLVNGTNNANILLSDLMGR